VRHFFSFAKIAQNSSVVTDEFVFSQFLSHDVFNHATVEGAVNVNKIAVFLMNLQNKLRSWLQHTGTLH